MHKQIQCSLPFVHPFTCCPLKLCTLLASPFVHHFYIPSPDFIYHFVHQFPYHLYINLYIKLFWLPFHLQILYINLYINLFRLPLPFVHCPPFPFVHPPCQLYIKLYIKLFWLPFHLQILYMNLYMNLFRLPLPFVHRPLLHLPTIQRLSDCRQTYQWFWFWSSKTLKSASWASIVLRSSERLRRLRRSTVNN